MEVYKMKNSEFKSYGIGETVEKTGITQKQLRYWEDQKYIPSPERIVCGDRAYRRYSEYHIQLLQLIKQYLENGYSIRGAAVNARNKLAEGGW
jgi:DNA-binding transcriptional MerR regulator